MIDANFLVSFLLLSNRRHLDGLRLVVLCRIGLVSTWNSRIFVWQAIVPYAIESSIPQLSHSLTTDLIKDLNRRMRREFAQL